MHNVCGEENTVSTGVRDRSWRRASKVHVGVLETLGESSNANSGERKASERRLLLV